MRAVIVCNDAACTVPLAPQFAYFPKDASEFAYFFKKQSKRVGVSQKATKTRGGGGGASGIGGAAGTGGGGAPSSSSDHTPSMERRHTSCGPWLPLSPSFTKSCTSPCSRRQRRQQCRRPSSRAPQDLVKEGCVRAFIGQVRSSSSRTERSPKSEVDATVGPRCRGGDRSLGDPDERIWSDSISCVKLLQDY